ncbi:hypothetical protein Vadar_013978 [Vaccinium darrowii]|uniref:Uncharacterized protein n=1 Tax=Vaccinium darrowii TaxID=229202 RepID=A0ACB7XHE7_9ERIC|nr:hypothetical protein Vadar_013978 [Vaccinium darrowii]
MLLPTYAEIVRQTNLGSLFKIQYVMLSLQVNPTFIMMCFISFEAMQWSFKNGCMPFIGVDVTFLKGFYGGILLTAIALDGYNGLPPLDHLKTIIGLDEQKPWTIIFDQQKEGTKGPDMPASEGTQPSQCLT